MKHNRREKYLEKNREEFHKTVNEINESLQKIDLYVKKMSKIRF
tara:strand:- start:38 stop:169 length:132 start_codon:yes stop_codon:yes gene_type:complete